MLGKTGEVFAKLFHQVVASSLTQKEPIGVRGVFFMLLAIADKDGNVPGTDGAIARIINVPIGTFSKALKALMKPDPESNSKEEGGRRVIRMSTSPGLFLVNYGKYSGIANDEQRRAYFREKKAEQREREKEQSIGSPVEEVKEIYLPESRAVLHYLNEKTGRHYREVDCNLAIITARMKEPEVDLEGVKKMIDRQVERWRGDDKMDQFLRPMTLFGKQKFDGYYGAKDLPVKNSNGDDTWVNTIK